MREIKFRAYIKNLGWMLPVSMIDFENETIYVSLDSDEWSNDPLEYDFDDNDIEIMQYTGMTDKNGKDIYEGDIVEAWSEGVKARGKIKRRIDGLWLMYPAWQNGTTWSLAPDKDGGTTVLVIGNIFENPELMEVSNDK